MNKIISKTYLAADVAQLVVEAPMVAQSQHAGQFVVVRCGNQGERIPLSIVNADPSAGTITLVVKAVGLSTGKICALHTGDSLTDVMGPLGLPSPIENYGTVVCCCGGMGATGILPIMRALKSAGCRLICVTDGFVLADSLHEASHEVTQIHGDNLANAAADAVKQITGSTTVDRVIVSGPVAMMKAVAQATQGIATRALLRSIVVGGMGMCGSCRVTVDGVTRHVCADGPEFDAHQVDFDNLALRLGENLSDAKPTSCDD